MLGRDPSPLYANPPHTSMSTVACEQCSRAIAVESVVYSSAGKGLCPSCHQAASIAEADAQSAASQRRSRVMLGAGVGLVLVLTAVMFAIGRGETLGYIYLTLGIASLGISLRGLVLSGGSIPLSAPWNGPVQGANPSAYRRSALRLLLFGLPLLIAGIVILVVAAPPKGHAPAVHPPSTLTPS